MAENDTRWHLAAKCQDQPQDLFFSGNPTKTRQAVAICQSCPVKAICGAEARDRGETYGVWGGVALHKVVTRAERRRPFFLLEETV